MAIDTTQVPSRAFAALIFDTERHAPFASALAGNLQRIQGLARAPKIQATQLLTTQNRAF